MHPNIGRQILLALIILTATYLIIDTITFKPSLSFIDGIVLIVLYKARESIIKW